MKTLSTLVLLLAALTAVAAAATITVTSAWSRPADATGVVYLTLTNPTSTADRLVKVTSPVAKAVELHESTETKMTMPMAAMKGGNASGMPMAGVASMHPVRFVPIPAHGSTKLAPGGYHIMLIDLRHPLKADQTFPIRLQFAHAGSQEVTVHVRY